MSKTINISIDVDTQALIKEYPDGGQIKNHTIINMTDSVADKNEEGIEDELITVVDPGDTLRWHIFTKNKLNNLKLTEFKYEEGTPEKVLFSTPPTQDLYDYKIWFGVINSNLPDDASEAYAFYFVNLDTNISWWWDPFIETRTRPSR